MRKSNIYRRSGTIFILFGRDLIWEFSDNEHEFNLGVFWCTRVVYIEWDVSSRGVSTKEKIAKKNWVTAWGLFEADVHYKRELKILEEQLMAELGFCEV